MGLCNRCIVYTATRSAEGVPVGYGCWRSHREVALYCSANDMLPSIVLEDDAVFVVKDVLVQLNRYTDLCVRDRLDMLLLGYLAIFLIPIGHTAIGVGACTHAYVLNHGFAEWLYATEISKHNRHLDVYSAFHFNKQLAYPAIAHQQSYGSDNIQSNLSERVLRPIVMDYHQYAVTVVSVTILPVIVMTCLMAGIPSTRRYSYWPFVAWLSTFGILMIIFFLLTYFF